MGVAWAFAIFVTEVLALAWLGPGASTWRTGVSWAVVLAALLVPFFVETSPVVSYALALLFVVPAMKVPDLARRPIASPKPRLLHLLLLLDTREAKPVARTFDRDALTRMVPWMLAAALAIAVAGPVANALPDRAGHFALRWAGCAGFGLVAFELLALNARFTSGLLGFEIPPVHDAPYLARSVREFWGTRWNRMAGGWLRAEVYGPLKPRLGKPAASFAVFGVSALVHWYVIAVSLGWFPSLLMGAFFLVQGATLLLENALHVRRWPVGAARAWTLGTILLASPLVLEPMMQMLDREVAALR